MARAKIGRFDKRVDILKRTVSGQNGSGEDVVTYPALYSGAWAEIKVLPPRRGQEMVDSSQQRWSYTQLEVLLRQCLTGIASGDRLVYDTHTYEILSAVDRDQDKRHLNIFCQEVK